MKVTFFSDDLSSNSLGRVYCLWRLADALGWDASVISPRGEEVWGPLRDTPFARACHRLAADTKPSHDEMGDPDLLIAVKPLPSSFLPAWEWSRALGIPLLVDIDDPDLEMQFSWERPIRRLGRILLRARGLRGSRVVRKRLVGVPRFVSNPWLQSRYGGTLLPHVRDDRGPGAAHASTQPRIAFVGTNQQHKGVSILRQAVAELAPEGFRLIVTDAPPADAAPHEEWVGRTSMEEGLSLVSGSDIVVIPSLDAVHARGQLPVKLIDAMMLGRAIVVTDVDPLPWAIGSGGVVIRAGSVSELVHALRSLSDPSKRARLGRSARSIAIARYTIGENRRAFEAACRAAVGVRADG
ncbi:glycosyltransferase [Labedella phragmitis]|uniref:Glycosyltransferase n=1 Tax=Labedella phragmitis TaxID=2498849 RepID=A0A3S4D8J7_9MICO|nr:glycosyltransferase family 4 protein [Labedella phragmitis]RWZ46602.1 glycosyltransferase [Labedella phragmitis]